MGLAERRIVKTFQESTFNKVANEIESIAGYKIGITVDWDSLAEDGMSHMYEEAWQKVYFEPLKEALSNICADEMGREALKEGLSKIEIKNSDSFSSASDWATLKNGTLTLDHKPTSNIDYEADRSKELLKTLENGL